MSRNLVSLIEDEDWDGSPDPDGFPGDFDESLPEDEIDIFEREERDRELRENW